VKKEDSFKYTSDWKEKNEKYLIELQKSLDIAENIEDEELRKSIIVQMIKCDKLLTELAEEMIK